MGDLDQVLAICQDTNQAAHAASKDAGEAAKGVAELSGKFGGLESWMKDHAKDQKDTEKEFRRDLDGAKLDLDRLKNRVNLLFWGLGILGTPVGLALLYCLKVVWFLRPDAGAIP